MARRNRPVADKRITFRCPDQLNTLLLALCIVDQRTMSDNVLSLLESHPRVVETALSLYNLTKDPSTNEDE